MTACRPGSYLLCLLNAVVLLGTASADPESLDGGVLIAHYVPEMVFSEAPPEGYCAHYLEHYAISHYSEQLNRIDVATYLQVTWFVLAAWVEPKTWCETMFGLGEYDPGYFACGLHGPCFCGDGLEVPSPGWPGPGGGVLLRALDTPWSGNYVPIYFFNGYAYGYGGSQVLPLGNGPGEQQPYFTNCASPAQAWGVASLGGLGINTNGIYSAPGEDPAACCMDQDCLMLPLSVCALLGGDPRSGVFGCLPNPCVPQTVTVRPDGTGDDATLQEPWMPPWTGA
jgi:hypothetical protein